MVTRGVVLSMGKSSRRSRRPEPWSHRLEMSGRRRAVRDEFERGVTELRAAKRTRDRQRVAELQGTVLPRLWNRARVLLRPEDYPRGLRMYVTSPRNARLIRDGREEEALQWLGLDPGIPPGRRAKAVRSAVRDAIFRGAELPAELFNEPLPRMIVDAG